MVVEDKIQDAKDCFEELSKSGYNNYQKFKYVETKDLFPVVRQVCKKFKLRTNFEWDNINNLMWLIVTDQEDKSEYRANIPVAPVTATDAGKHMQDIGRIQTYSMRYLYIQVFEIAVPDEIDNEDQKKFKKGTINQAPAKTTKKTQYSPVNPIQEEHQDEVTAERIQDIITKAEKKFHNEQLKKLGKDREPFTWDNAKDYIREQCKTEQEFKICEQSTTFKKANKI